MVETKNKPRGIPVTRRNKGRLRSVQRVLYSSPYKGTLASTSKDLEVEMVQTEEPKALPVITNCLKCFEKAACREPGWFVREFVKKCIAAAELKCIAAAELKSNTN